MAARLKTKFTEMCGIEHPLMQGGMHFVGYAEMAAAVSEAGGLGTITALTQPSPEALRDEIRKAKNLTKKPLCVNLTLLPMLAPPNYQDYADVIVNEGIRIIETAGRDPSKWIKFFKSKGCIVIHKCVQVKHAITAQKMGADMVSMDGYECGGHPGEHDVTNWVLFAKALKTLKIPYLASGACGTGAQLAAAIGLGCEGMNMGTRWMCTKEAPIQQGIKDAIVKASEYDTTLVFTTLANTERVFKNACSEEVRAREKKDPGDFSKIADLVKGMNYKKSFQETGNPDDSVWSCGQVIGLIDDVPTCKVLAEKIVTEAIDIIENKISKCVVRGSPSAKL